MMVFGTAINAIMTSVQIAFSEGANNVKKNLP